MGEKRTVKLTIEIEAEPTELLLETLSGSGGQANKLLDWSHELLEDAIKAAVCPLCNGSGELGYRKTMSCPCCNGTGWSENVGVARSNG